MNLENPDTLDMDKFFKIHEWAGKRQADLYGVENFIETDTSRLLYHLLFNQRGLLLVVIGPQGVGKTITRKWLAKELGGQSSVISVAWESIDQIIGLIDQFRKKTEIIEKEVERRKEVPRIKEERNKTPFGLASLRDESPTKIIYTTEKLKEERIYYDKDPSWILIDFEDYHMTYRRRPINDLIDLQRLIIRQSHPPQCKDTTNRDSWVQDLRSNIVIFYQSELWATLKHFWTGKPRVIELKPFEPAKLVENYHELWGYPLIFSPEALLEIAEMSRGIFRWFMKYIDLCLNNQILKFMKEGEIQTLTLDDIHAIIEPSQIIREWENEFKALFPRSEDLRLNAEIIMRYLKQNGRTAQKIIRDRFFEPEHKGEQTCSRLLSRLEEAGYIKRNMIGRKKYIEIV